jgi:hypothetical protein
LYFGYAFLIPRDQSGESDDDADGIRYAEWDIARLVLLPKSINLFTCKKWRGVCLRDIASNAFSSMCVRRLQMVMGEEING